MICVGIVGDLAKHFADILSEFLGREKVQHVVKGMTAHEYLTVLRDGGAEDHLDTYELGLGASNSIWSDNWIEDFESSYITLSDKAIVLVPFYAPDQCVQDIKKTFSPENYVHIRLIGSPDHIVTDGEVLDGSYLIDLFYNGSTLQLYKSAPFITDIIKNRVSVQI